VPSLQFYLGYPARFISAKFTVAMLQMQGLPVSQSGTYLQWQGQLIQFDAPCSGVVMLWAGLFLTLFIGWLYQFNRYKTLAAVVIAIIFVLIGNVLRASSLFYLETGMLEVEQPWMHEAVGVAAFLMIAIGIIYTMKRLQLWSPNR
jgi:exosortase/archaeosortase family protein